MFDTLSFSSVSLFAAIALYALMGEPTPDHPGMLEAVVALLLGLSIGPSRVVSLCQADPDKPVWYVFGQIFFFFGTFFSLSLALLNGNSAIDILRDYIAFMFLFLPLFFYGREKEIGPVVSAGLLFIGVMFSFRTVWPLWESGVLFNVWNASPPDLLYLANAPAVFFAVLFLFFLVGTRMTSTGLFNKATGLLFLCLACLPLVAMSVMMQRATLVLSFVFLMIFCIHLLVRRPAAVWFFLCPVAIGAYMSFPVFEALTALLVHKTQIVGLNSRKEEAAAVYRALEGSSGTLLSGLGFGGRFENPAVGFLYINFTHNLFTYTAIKSGLAGVFLCFLYGGALALNGWRLARKNLFYALCLIFPLFINVFLYSGYKSFSFGLLLLLVSMQGQPRCLKRPFCASESVTP